MNQIKRSLPTLEDVAKTAGVSTATVSRCLNEPKKVSENTRTRVMEAVDALRYTPNFGARAIAANRTGIIGAVIPTMENAIFARGIEAFQSTLATSNTTMIVASYGYDPKLEAKLIRTLIGRGADGVLLIGTEREPEVYAYLDERNIPYVIAWAASSEPTRSFVGFDNRRASMELVSEALKLGHTRCAYVAAKMNTNDRARDRMLGAQDALRDANLDPGTMQVVETEYSIDHARAAFAEIARSGRLPTLIICGNDVLGVGIVKAAQDSGLNVPADISVLGFDDIELATVVSPELTTVHVPHGTMGQKAAEALLSLLKNPDATIRTTLNTNIVSRQSLTAPKPA